MDVQSRSGPFLLSASPRAVALEPGYRVFLASPFFFFEECSSLSFASLHASCPRPIRWVREGVASMPKPLAHSDGSGGPCIDRQDSARDPTSLVPGQESHTSSCVVVVVRKRPCEAFTSRPDLEALTNIPSCVDRAFSRRCARRQWGPERKKKKGAER